MASWSIALPNFVSLRSDRGSSTDSRFVIDPALTNNNARVLFNDIRIRTANQDIRLNVGGGDLSNEWETNGSLTLSKGDVSFEILISSQDRSEPYVLRTPLYSQILAAVSRGGSGWTLTLDDGVVSSKMYLGDTRIDKMYLGSREITKAYLGDTLVFGS